MKPPKKTPVSGCVLAGPYLCAAQVARGKGARGQHFGTLAKLCTELGQPHSSTKLLPGAV